MRQITSDFENRDENETRNTTDRRGFLGKLGKAAIIGTAASTFGLKATALVVAQEKRDDDDHDDHGGGRASRARRIRRHAADAEFEATPEDLRHPTNGDEQLYPNRIGNYSKGMPHDANGEVSSAGYGALLQAVESGNPADYDAIPLGGARRFTSPQSGLAFDLEGGDSQSFVEKGPPRFASREIAAEIAENYWMALLRDVPFADYASNPIANAAAFDLNLFGTAFKGPKDGSGQVTPDLLFCGLTAGDRTGPWMSQFWYMPCFFGANEVNQRTRTVMGVGSGGQNYMTNFAAWLAIQRGAAPATGNIFDPVSRYMRNGRDIGQWVHVDVLFQGYFQAFLCIAGAGIPFDAGNPYSSPNPSSVNQDGFATFGGPHLATILCEVATRALHAVWYQKWQVHRRLRPEVFAARVHQTLNMGRPYPAHPDILNSVQSAARLGGYLTPGNALLPMAFPEGSPTHPAYGAGHATVAGACVTILKAWFSESAIISGPVVPNAAGTALASYSGPALTVGGELNKIASNIANGRNIAGVHWRSDATESLKLGEAVALSILRDQRPTYNEVFNGFSLTKFDGTTVTV